MRGLKSTVGLLVILIGLGAYIYFDRNREIADPNAKPKAYAALATDDIEELQIRNASGETTRLQRAGAGEEWQIVEPVKAAADSGVVGTVTSNIGTLEVQRVVDENPSDLKQYGLDPARLEVAFRLKGQKELQRVLVGDKTPAGGDLFAKRGDENRVILVSSFLDSIFSKTPFDLRDKIVLAFDRDKAEGVEVVSGAMTRQFARNGTDWRIVRPVTVRADYAAAEGLLTRLSSTNMQTVVAEEGDLAMYGLDRPSTTATVLTGSSRASLLIGRMADGGGYYAKDANRPMVFTVEQALVTDLTKEIGELRRKDLFDSRSFSATRVEFQRPGATTALERADAEGQTTWKNATGATVETARIEEALTKLSSLRADAFQPMAHASLKTPVMTATVRFDDNKTETVTFARAGTEVYASRTDEPGSARVDATAFDDALKAVDALK